MCCKYDRVYGDFPPSVAVIPVSVNKNIRGR